MKLVVEALQGLPDRVRHSMIVDSSGLKSTGDQAHFSTASQRVLGRRYAQAMAMATRLGLGDIKIPAESTTAPATDSPSATE